MSELVEKTPHKYREGGVMLKFNNGHEYSVVNLASKFTTSDDRAGLDEECLDYTARMYDSLGGRYEAILLPESNDGEWGDPIRAHALDAVIDEVISRERYK